jgi:uncharacterized membrane protein YhiD involved in acid resistance
MTSSLLVRLSSVALTLMCLGPPVVVSAFGGDGGQPPFPAAEAAPLFEASSEIRMAIERLSLAALFGTALAFRPRRRSQGGRNVVVIQTQIMLAVVGAVIMLVVGNSLSRAFGIVGAAGLIRYRASIADPKDAVVMLCALASGLSVGVGLYRLGVIATLFMMVLLWSIEWLEPPPRKQFELRIKTTAAVDFRSKAEDVMKGLSVEFDLMVEEPDELRYAVSAPVTLRTRDVSDTLRLVGGDDVICRWEEKRPTRG